MDKPSASDKSKSSTDGGFDALQFFRQHLHIDKAVPYVPPVEREALPPVIVDTKELLEEEPREKDDAEDLDDEVWTDPPNAETQPESKSNPGFTLVETQESTQTRPAFGIVASNSKSRSGLRRFVPSIQWLPELLVERGRISADEMEVAVTFHRQYAGRSCFSATLIKLELISSKEILNILHERYNLPRAKLSKQKLTYEIFSVCPLSTCKKLSLLAFSSPTKSKTVCVVVSAPSDEVLREAKAIAVRTRCRLELEIANEAGINAVIEELSFHKQNDGDAGMKEIRQIFVDAIDEGSSDVHFEPLPEVFRVRYRVDGLLRTVRIYPHSRKEELIRSTLLFAGMDVGKPTIPQDQEMELFLRAKTYKLRMSSIPTTTGHSIVGRLLDKEAGMVSFDELGMEDDHAKMLTSILELPNGAIVNVGPTGSGKSTSMLAILSTVNATEEKILTIENPPEYRIAQAQQVKYHQQNISFAAALRSFMRQDPDHIMVGEIRDLETCESAITAALTGHKVYSTLHGNHALTGLQRFIDWKVDLSLVAEGVAIFIAQRLIPRLCQKCRVPHRESARVVSRYNIKLQGSDVIYDANPAGCPECNKGFAGRIGAFELIPISFDAEMQDVIARGGENLIPRCVATAKNKGYRFMRDDAFLKVGRGLTTVSQVLANIGKVGGEGDSP